MDMSIKDEFVYESKYKVGKVGATLKPWYYQYIKSTKIESSWKFVFCLIFWIL